MTVTVIINEATTGAPPHLGVKQTGLPRHIGEGAIAVVVIQRVASVRRNKEIIKAVVIVIADSDCRGPFCAEQTGIFRHIEERSIAVVLVEAATCAFRRPVQPRAAEYE